MNLADLKAFERRLTEIVQFLQPPTTQWRVLLAAVVLCVVSGAWKVPASRSVRPSPQWRANHSRVYFHVYLTVLSWNFPCLPVGANMWLFDPETSRISLSASLRNHWFFSMSVFALIALFVCGVHRRVVMPAIVIQRARNVLEEFNMNCDDTGRLILKPRPQQ